MSKFDFVKRGVGMFPGEYRDYFEQPPKPKKGLPKQKPKSKRRKR